MNNKNNFSFLGICVCIPLLMVLALFFMPDSPKFLISKNRISEARQALRWFRGPNYDVDSEFKQILTSNKEEENIGGISLLELFTQKVYFVPFLIAMYGMFGQQFCGINVVFFYLQTIFDKANSTVDPSKHTLFEIFIFCPKIQLWFPEKIVDFFGWKTRENVAFCQSWIFGQKFDFSNSVYLLGSTVELALSKMVCK